MNTFYVFMDTGEKIASDHTGCIFVLNHGVDWHFYVAVVTVTNKKHGYMIGEANIKTFFGEVTVPGNDIFVLSDTGDNSKTLEMLRQNISLASLIIHAGDMSYATNSGECYNNAEATCMYDCPLNNTECMGRHRDDNPLVIQKWINFFERLQPISSQIPIITTMGNHDNDLIWFFKFRPPHVSSLIPIHLQHYVDKFQDEYKGATVEIQQALLNQMLTHGHYYSVSIGSFLIMSITSEDNAVNPYESLNNPNMIDVKRFENHFGKGSPQYIWCEERLSSIDRETHPIVVMFSHRPLYHTSRHHPSCKKGGDWYGCRFLETYMPLLEKYSVDLFFSGHSHHYARTHPVHLDEHGMLQKIDKKSPVLFVVGNGGFKLSQGYSVAPDWIATRDDKHYGFGVLTTMNWRMIDSENGRVIDEHEYI
jgi:predicted phosphodiesterase